LRGGVRAKLHIRSSNPDVSQKTVEALFGTKASLLKETVDFAIRGDVQPIPIRQREAVAEMEAAAGASEMLDLTQRRYAESANARPAWRGPSNMPHEASRTSQRCGGA
jgi:hypothetical protein